VVDLRYKNGKEVGRRTVEKEAPGLLALAGARFENAAERDINSADRLENSRSGGPRKKRRPLGFPESIDGDETTGLREENRE